MPCLEGTNFCLSRGGHSTGGSILIMHTVISESEYKWQMHLEQDFVSHHQQATSIHRTKMPVGASFLHVDWSSNTLRKIL